jgi:tRNA threonylcarbamoyladenosine biosynthesis protein TsaE
MGDITVFTKNDRETQKVAAILARECLRGTGRERALVLGLVGDLGGGKTTFTAGFAKALGIKERVTSPTFVLMKKFKISAVVRKNRKSQILNHKLFIHIDAYRLESARELVLLGWKEMTLDPKNIIVVEWADKIKKILPKDAIVIKFKHLKGDGREIIINQKPNIKYQNHRSKIKNKPVESISF